jgi:TRAP-type C4-dicarboxylate transport system permease small subunit
MSRFQYAVYRATVIGNWASRVSLFLMMLAICTNIIGRVFGRPILGIYEVVIFLFLATISMSIAFCAVQKGHVFIDMFTNKLPRHWQRAIDIVLMIPSIIVWALATWQLFLLGNGFRLKGQLLASLLVPEYPIVWVQCLGFLLLCLVLLSEFSILLSRKR